MAVTPGARLGVYDIGAPIGEGGMGQVYRATDTTLGREVAIKILPDAFAGDADRLARFEREAKTLASLNHPHIATVYGFEKSAGVNALVMELVDGDDLSRRIARGPIPFDEALPIARQIAEALEAAHEQGIVHRDLKPANIKIRSDGTVKILDFGLAKALSPEAGGAGGASALSMSPTLSVHATMAGVILGTAAYMSPEQAKGRAVDKRSDIWAFGAVLFELLTGRKAFDGDDVTDVIASVVKSTPDWSLLPADVPPHIVTLIQRCLEKDRKTRIGDIAVARFLLEGHVAAPRWSSAPAAAVPSRAWLRRLPWALAGVFLITTLALSFLVFRETPAVAESVRIPVSGPENGVISQFKLSPDGRRLVLVAAVLGGRSQLWVRSLDSLIAVPLAGTDGAQYPFWSADGTQIGFFAQGKLKKIAAAGGPALILCDAVNGRSGTWNRDGVILFAPDALSGLFRVAEAGGIPVAVTTIAGANEGDRYPEFLPDGHRFLFLRALNKNPGLYGGDLSGAAPVQILPDVTNAAFVPGQSPRSPDGYLLFRRDNTLMAQAFDPERLQTSGGVVPIAEQVGILGNVGVGAFTASRTGTIAYRSGGVGTNRQLVWFDRSGKRVGVVGKPGEVSLPALSPDGKMVVFTIGNTTAGGADLWLQSLETGVLSKFTFGPWSNDRAVWSPDGSRIAYVSGMPSTQFQIALQSSTGSGRPDVLLPGPFASIVVSDWSRDGRFIVFNSRSERTKDDIWVLSMEGDRKATPFLQAPANEGNAVFSPGGDWIAYQSDESGQPEIYVQHFPANGSKYQISSAGGISPRWSRDGKELFYEGWQRNLVSVPVTADATFARGQARTLFENVPFAGTFQPSADGRRFLAVVTEGEPQAPPVVVITNWPTTLKK